MSKNLALKVEISIESSLQEMKFALSSLMDHLFCEYIF